MLTHLGLKALLTSSHCNRLFLHPQIAEARAAGQARKEEAIRRREEFVIKQSEAKLVSSKSVQQLNAEREEMIAREVAKIQVRVDNILHGISDIRLPDLPGRLARYNQG